VAVVEVTGQPSPPHVGFVKKKKNPFWKGESRTKAKEGKEKKGKGRGTEMRSTLPGWQSPFPFWQRKCVKQSTLSFFVGGTKRLDFSD